MNKLTFHPTEDGSIIVNSIDLIDYEGGDSPIEIGKLDRNKPTDKFSFELQGVSVLSSDEILELAEKLKEINPQ